MDRVVLAASLALFAAPAAAGPPPPDSAEAHDLDRYRSWFAQQHNAYGMMCCSVADGREVDVRELHGHYAVRFLHPGSIAGVRPNADTWYPVPDEAILHGPNPTGHAIAWWSPYPFMRGSNPDEGHVRCFINTDLY